MWETEGNLIDLALEGHFDVIVHGCNCFNTMGSGIAKEIKERLPEAYKVDQETVKGDRSKLGGFTFTDVCRGDEWFTVINMYTQYSYGGQKDHFEYEKFREGLENLNTFLPLGSKIGFPKIGAGLAGGDWKRIKQIIYESLPNHEVAIVYYEP